MAKRRTPPQSQLKSATKSVLFYKGMTDDTDRFLAKSPAVDYTENLYEERDGSYSKRPGFESLGWPGGPTISLTDPYMLHSVNDTLYTMTERAGLYYDGEWGDVENNGDIGIRNLEIPVRTPAKWGARSYTSCVSRDGLYYCVAFSTKVGVPEAAFANDHEVTIQSYSIDGTFRGEQRLPLCMDPQVFPKMVDPAEPDVDPGIHVYYLDTGEGAFAKIKHNVYHPATNSFAGSDSSLVDCYWDGAWSFDGDTNAPDPASARIGFATARGEQRSAEYQIDFADDGSAGILLYKGRGGIDPDILLWRLASNGRNYGVTSTIVSGNSTSSPLAVAISSDGSELVSMHVERQGTAYPTQKTLVRVVKYQYSDMALSWFEDIVDNVESGDFENYYGHGSVVFNDSTNDVLAMFHKAPEETAVWCGTGWNTGDIKPVLEYTELASATGSPSTFNGTLYAQRLASRLACDGGKYYAVLQQWSVYTPKVNNAGDDAIVGNTILGPQNKPVSSVLCEIQDGGNVSVLGVMGANASRRCNPSSDETTTQLPKLWSLGADKFMHINRQILVQEDLLWSLRSPNTRLVAAFGELSPPEAFAALNVVSKEMENVRSESFGNGIMVGSAIPIWLTGTSMSEAYVIDRPEIVGIEDDDGGPPSDVYWENVYTAQDNTEYTKLQVVVGFVDSAGNVHRSAPSQMVWGNLGGGDAEQKSIKVYFTPPISAFSGRRDYFAELYMSPNLDSNLKLAGTTKISVRDYDSWSDIYIPTSPNVEYNTALNTAYRVARSSPNVFTDGGVLAPIAWPSIKDFAVASRRAWLISKQYPGSVFYTKLFEENVSPEFCGEQIISLGEERDLTCIGILDDKAVVFEKNDIHIIYGDGPDNRGRGQDFAVEYITTGAIGCEDPRSVVETPAGLMFYNRARGFYLLDRDRQLRYVGAGVKDLTRDLVVKAATTDPREAEVRFLVDSTNPVDSDGPDADPATSAVDRPPTPWFGNSLPEDSCLSFNYESGIWALYTNYKGSASTLYQGRYTRAMNLGFDGGYWWRVWKESGELWTDPVVYTVENRTLMRSHWIELGQQIQDYERLWRITLLGRYLSSLQDMGFESVPYIFDEKVGTGGGFASGEVRFNAVNLIDATICRVQNIDANGEDRTALWGSVAGADVSVLSDAGNGCVFQCSTTTDAGAFHELDIAPGSVVISGDPLVDSDEVTATPQIPTYEAGDIVVRLYYDYEKDYTQEKRFYMQDFGYDPFNDPQKRTERMQCVITPNRGRCQAVKIEIEEVNSEARTGEGLIYGLGRGFEIVSADLLLGISEPKTTPFISSGVRK